MKGGVVRARGGGRRAEQVVPISAVIFVLVSMAPLSQNLASPPVTLVLVLSVSLKKERFPLLYPRGSGLSGAFIIASQMSEPMVRGGQVPSQEAAGGTLPRQLCPASRLRESSGPC